MFLSLPELQKERGFPHPSRKKKLLKLKRESTCSHHLFRPASPPVPHAFLVHRPPTQHQKHDSNPIA
jgi:hypothetical protein